MSNVLLSMIHKRSGDTWTGAWPAKKEDYSIWYKHWFASAAKIRDELRSEGLSQSADAVQRIIDEQMSYGHVKEMLNGKE